MGTDGYPRRGPARRGILVAVLALLGACQGGTPPATTGAPPASSDIQPEGPLNIAHAGGDAAHPHSTLFGYAESVLEGADVLELDVQLSADRVLVVHHDETVDATTDGHGAVVERTLDQLQELDAAYRWSAPCPSCEPGAENTPDRGIRTAKRPAPVGYEPDDFAIPTLRQVATRFPELPLDIEIKGERHSDPMAVARALADELGELGRIESSVVVSFDSAVVRRFHQLAPEVAVSPGRSELTDWLLNGRPLAEQYSIIQIPPSVDGVPLLSANVVKRAHAEGLDVWVWASDVDQERAQTYGEWLALGVDGVIAGRPEEMTQARATRE